MSDVKSFPFPVLSPDSIDYLDCEYNPEFQPRAEGYNKVTVRHVLTGRGLISELLDSGKAVFGCMVSLPSTMYRRVIFADNSHEKNPLQEIEYGDSGYGQVTSAVESPMFRPIILAQEGIEKTVSDSDRLNPLWKDSLINIPKGSIIAYAGWARFDGSMGGLLRVELDSDLSEGEMRVEDDTEGGFRFRVRLGRELFDNVQEPSDDTIHQRNSILTHALSASFSLLRKEYGDADAYGDYINLRAAADMLKQEGLGHWGEDDFHPEQAATVMYPHVFPENSSEGEDVD